MLLVILLLLLLLLTLISCQNTKDGWDSYHDNMHVDMSSIPACRAISLLKGSSLSSSLSSSSDQNDVIVIGDVHGAYDGLLENLYNANITEDSTTCDWNDNTHNTLLIQVGDVVDRGDRSYDSYFCLKRLQQTCNNNNKVIRLLGNHDIWWLEGSMHMKNTNESLNNANTVVSDMKNSIIDNSLHIAYSKYHKGIPLLFTHAGLRNEMIAYINLTDIDLISKYINDKLLQVINKCKDTKCSFKDELFQAGKERGGTNIGGCTWTDYSILLSQSTLPLFHQVVGHSIHDRIRASRFLGAIDVDLGMTYSKNKRGFLKITEHGKFLAYEKTTNNNDNVWKIRDLSQNICY